MIQAASEMEIRVLENKLDIIRVRIISNFCIITQHSDRRSVFHQRGSVGQRTIASGANGSDIIYEELPGLCSGRNVDNINAIFAFCKVAAADLDPAADRCIAAAVEDNGILFIAAVRFVERQRFCQRIIARRKIHDDTPLQQPLDFVIRTFPIPSVRPAPSQQNSRR